MRRLAQVFVVSVFAFGPAVDCLAADDVTPRPIELIPQQPANQSPAYRGLTTEEYISAYEACYRAGRCSYMSTHDLREHVQRLHRVAPQAPLPNPMPQTYEPRNVMPTPEDSIRPEYRDASRLREPYRREERSPEPPAR